MCGAGLTRPLTLLERSLHISQANMPTSASMVKLSSMDAFMFSIAPRSEKRRGVASRQLPPADRRSRLTPTNLPLAATRPGRASIPLQLQPRFKPALRQPASQRSAVPKRALLDKPIPFISQPITAYDFTAHEHPVYGYTNPDFDYRSEISFIRDTAQQGYNAGTTRVEKGHHKKWMAFCSVRGLRHIRDDHEANSGRDRAGYQREIDILAAFLLQCHKEMPARGHRPQALPSSAANVVRGVRRIHQKHVPRIDMVPFAAVADVLKGMNTQYLHTHQYQMMLRKRAEPWRRHHLHRLLKLRIQLGTPIGRRHIAYDIFWLSYFAMIETMASTGSRKSEMAVEGLWKAACHLSRGSLLWCIAGVEVRSPTPQQLRQLTEDDYAILCPPPSKTDAFGVIWGDKPMYLPVRFTSAYCAALRLSELELLYPVAETDRLQVPLFCQEPNVPMTFSILERVLKDIKDLIMPEVEDKSVFTYHSFRVLLATQLGCAKRSGPEIQAMCRWQSPASLAIYVRMQPREAIRLLDEAQNAVISSYSTVNLPPIKHIYLSNAVSHQSTVTGTNGTSQ